MRFKTIGMPVMLLLASFSVSAETINTSSTADASSSIVTQTSPAISLLQDYQHAFRQRQYEISYIVVRQGHIEPVRLIHGVVNDVEVAHRVYLNGPANEAVYRDGTVAFFEPGQTPYSLSTTRLPGMFGNLAAVDLAHLQANYDLVIAGKSRVAGRPAQVMRIVPKSSDLYGLYFWIDYGSQLPLRLDIVDQNGELVEQQMAVTLSEFEQPSEWMVELSNLDLPSTVVGKEAVNNEKHKINWRLGWQPKGMNIAQKEQHSLAVLSESVDYIKLSDGLFDISVYANAIGQTNPLREQLVRQGATSLHTVVRKGIEITVVGEIPPETASKIADSVVIGPYLEKANEPAQ
ncbi:MucB/RseB C-terminal domain-containing protein [Agarivorans sp. 1_MG-2023]|uniref:MucB/RseB C-terminal domain-containing protein n=2 Tax=unclassified Agarivorans TaxID=2636026 RepID=UPI0026E25EBD|nr:MucB/RseB C-terminal domain-containing protein [Agarivorans sp. 1_MG-2023]MDO6763138.1 MucB/RseB C-terminal domain-containing protein [Agarivorans sp. 1_MG-2023]